MSRFNINVMLVGGSQVGKSSLIRTYISHYFIDSPVHSYEDLSEDLRINNERFHIRISESLSGDFQDLRSLSYSNIDVFLLCYSCVSRTSLAELESIWFPEINSFFYKRVCKLPPLILVGTKSDLKTPTVGYLPNDEVNRLAKWMGASAALECSALKYDDKNPDASNVKLVFYRALWEVYQNRNSAPVLRACSCVIF